MTSRDLVINTLNHEPTIRVPRHWWPMPEIESSRDDEIAELELRFPSDIIPAELPLPHGKRDKSSPRRDGRLTDAWGCTWQPSPRGEPADVKHAPLAESSAIAAYTPPDDLPYGNRQLAEMSRCCAATSRFVLAEAQARPFDRLRLLRGHAAAIADLRSSAKHLPGLLAMLHDFFCREMEAWAETEVDGVVIRDNWGAGGQLEVESQVWRDFFKPLYRDYCKILHSKDKFVFFRADGNISKIFGELVRIDVDAIHARLSVTEIERLAKRYRGRVTFGGGIDQRHTLPFGTDEEIRAVVLRMRRELDFGAGGVIAQCEWGPDVPLRNLVTVFEQWVVPLPMHA